MFRVLICICWQTKNKNMLQEKELIFSEARLIEGQARPIENHRKIISVDFKSGPSSRKCLGFQSNIPKYKRKTLTTF